VAQLSPWLGCDLVQYCVSVFLHDLSLLFKPVCLLRREFSLVQDCCAVHCHSFNTVLRQVTHLTSLLNYIPSRSINTTPVTRTPIAPPTCIPHSLATRDYTATISPRQYRSSYSRQSAYNDDHKKQDETNHIITMAGVRDPAFWKRFSVAVHMEEDQAPHRGDLKDR
jgi:hypothetical protein